MRTNYPKQMAAMNCWDLNLDELAYPHSNSIFYSIPTQHGNERCDELVVIVNSTTIVHYILLVRLQLVLQLALRHVDLCLDTSDKESESKCFGERKTPK